MLCKLMQLCEMMGLQDLNLLVDLDIIRKRPDYHTFDDLVEKRSMQCSVKWNGMDADQVPRKPPSAAQPCYVY